tara:strand:- start:3580 stop:4305 length:726 start_codon:yes stop_codon:yes gene_type:complete
MIKTLYRNWLLIRLVIGPILVLKRTIIYYKSSIEELRNTFIKEGFVPLPSLSKKELSLLRADCERELREVLKAGSSVNGRKFKDHAWTKTTQLFDKKYRPFAAKMLNSSNVRLELVYYQISKPEKSSFDVPGGNFHTDFNRENLKIFIYLSNVNKNTGPLALYFPTQSMVGRFFRWTFLEVFQNSTKLLYKRIGGNLKKGKEVLLLGKAGSVFGINTTEFHKANIIKSGKRQVFVLSYLTH